MSNLKKYLHHLVNEDKPMRITCKYKRGKMEVFHPAFLYYLPDVRKFEIDTRVGRRDRGTFRFKLKDVVGHHPWQSRDVFGSTIIVRRFKDYVFIEVDNFKDLPLNFKPEENEP